MNCPTCEKEVSIVKREVDEFGKVINYFSCGHRLFQVNIEDSSIGLVTISLKKKDRNNNIYEESSFGETIGREGRVISFQKINDKVNKTCKESINLKGDRIRKMVDDELTVAEKFINYLNKNEGTDFILPKRSEDVEIDALSYSQSNPKNILKIQIVSSDFKARESLGKKGAFQAFRSIEELIQETIINPIAYKSRRYSPDFKKEVILLLDGWWTVTKEDLDFFKTRFLNSFEFLQNAGFKEIWFVSMKDDGPIYKLYP